MTLETGIFLMGGLDFFSFVVGIVTMIFLYMTWNEPQERYRTATTSHRPEEVPQGVLTPLLFELPRLLAWVYLMCSGKGASNLRARKIYLRVQLFTMIFLALIALLTISITFAYIPNNYDERYCNARSAGSDTPEAWSYYEEHRLKRL